MSDYRREILEMLAAGKITADEAERLIAAFESHPASGDGGNGGAGSAAAPAKARPKYLRVQVEADESMTGLKGGATTVNVRVPMQLLRAGVRLAGSVPNAFARAVSCFWLDGALVETRATYGSGALNRSPKASPQSKPIEPIFQAAPRLCIVGWLLTARWQLLRNTLPCSPTRV
jgi:hypothetical protein